MVTKFVRSMKILQNPAYLSRLASRNPGLVVFPFLFIVGLLIFMLAGQATNTPALQVTSQKEESHFLTPQQQGDTSDIVLNEEDLGKEFILSDSEKKISPAYQVGRANKRAVEFWYNMFTKYSNTNVVIYNKLKPWVIYDIIDISDLSGPAGVKLRSVARVEQIRATLKVMATKAVPQLTSDEEIRLYKLYEAEGGFAKSQILADLENIVFLSGQRNAFRKSVLENRYKIGAIERIFKAQKVDWEISRVFLFKEILRLRLPKTNRLIRNAVVDEFQNPIKKARLLAKVLGKKGSKKLIRHIESSFGDPKSLFVASLHAEQYYENLYPDLNYAAFDFGIKAYRLNRATKASNLAMKFGISLKEFFNFNSDIIVRNGSTLLPTGYVFFVRQRSTKTASL